MKKTLLALGASVALLGAQNLDWKIGQMLMLGFYGTSAPQGSKICNDIAKYHIGSVILFDYNPINKAMPKNIASKAQLAQLTKELKRCSYDGKLLIAVDQEGGKVQRLKSKYGFYGKFPSAKATSSMSNEAITKAYDRMAKELHDVGINYDLAPVVDLDINPQNYVIHKLGRSFGASAKVVAEKAARFIDSMHKYNVLTSLKHFPGHGSSVGDTHKGFVEVTKLWKDQELLPYKKLASKADSVMVAHVFNKNLDPYYPATLSKETISLLRNRLGFKGVVLTDDLQMGAITRSFNLDRVLSLALNADEDILLFGNQINPKNQVDAKMLIEKIKTLIAKGVVDSKTIEHSYNRIQQLKSKI